MAEVRRRAAASSGVAQNDGVMITSEPSKMMEIDPVRLKLRQRWELASVLNFLHVFNPVIQSNLKMSAEDIETALIEQNSTLAQLHIAILKGIIPTNQTLNSPDAWVIAVKKILLLWWPWVAKGDYPFTGVNGEDIAMYKGLEPTNRLLILKALCEVRADQYDAVSYINDSMKDGTEISYFKKGKLASDGERVMFWYDGSETIGHRLYKEVLFFENEQGTDKGTVAEISCQWETLATNLEEFKKLANELSSSEVKWEAALRKSIEIDILPVLEKQWKKKQKALLQQRREQMILNGFRNAVGTRSFRSCKPVDYRFDDYDKAISEAIQYTNERRSNEEQREEKPSQCEKRKRPTSNESTESDVEGSSHQESDYSVEFSDEEKGSGSYQGKIHSHEQNKPIVNRPKGSRFSKRLAGIPGYTIPENVNFATKNRLRQRPSVNTAVEILVVTDSEEET